jgi:hypothetical protein
MKKTTDSMMIAHKEALESGVDAYHDFLSTYRNNEKTLYGFVEGDEDKSYYYCILQRLMPSKWNVILFSCRCKSNVVSTMNIFNWDDYPKNRIIFIIDRDLDDIFSVERTNADMLYTTNGYSIENYLATSNVFRMLLECNCKLQNAKPSEYEYAASLFEMEFEKFISHCQNIMKWIIYNRYRNTKAQYKNIDMDDIYSFQNNQLVILKRPNGCKTLYSYCQKKCSGQYNRKDKEAMTFISKHKLSKNNVRGKYVIWFFVFYFNHIIRNAKTIFQAATRPVSRRCELNKNNAIQLSVPYSDTPESFKAFIERTFMRYIDDNP